MYPTHKFKLIGLFVGIILTGCSSTVDLATPDKMGEKERLHVISGSRAEKVVNRMHGQSVATDANAIAVLKKVKIACKALNYGYDMKM